MSPRKRAVRPWVVDDDDRLSPAGRPRSGPRGLAVRELPRLTIRADRAAIRTWLAYAATDERPRHVVFRELVSAAVAQLPAARRADVERRARALARDDRADDVRS